MTPAPCKYLILGFSGFSPEKEFWNFISVNPPAGFLLLSDNFRNDSQLKSLIADLRMTAGKDCLIMVDQEPGRVQRFKNGFPVSKKPRHYLKQGNIGEYRIWCSATAEKLAELGVDTNLAPLVDLLPLDREYQVLNDRSFGDEPERVAEYAMILMEEFRKFHIHTCGKHFPGLGSATGDPHEVLAKSDDRLERFLDYHWNPFRAIIKGEVPMIMTTHLRCPALDSENPATYSGNVISHLRNTLGHKGLVISDDLYMGGAMSRDKSGEAAIASIEAGHNLLIISRDLQFQKDVALALEKRYEENRDFAQMCSDNKKMLKALHDAD